MKTELFAELMASAKEALEHAKGKQELRTTKLPGAPKLMQAADIRALRAQVNASQSVFAHFLNVSTKLVQAWESDRRQPDGPALRLLELAEQEPALVFRGLVQPAAKRSAKKSASKGSSAKAVSTKARSAARSPKRSKKRTVAAV